MGLSVWEDLIKTMDEFVESSSDPLPPDDAELDESGAPRWDNGTDIDDDD